MESSEPVSVTLSKRGDTYCATLVQATEPVAEISVT